MSSSAFVSPSGILIQLTETALPEDPGLDRLVDRLDRERGAIFSSAVSGERYARWDFGFAGPPLEIIGRQTELELRALNQRGVALLAIIEPLLTSGDGTAVIERTEHHLLLSIEPSRSSFAEEERSRQPSVLTPLRRLAEDLRGFGDPALGLYGAFGHELLFQFDPIRLTHPRTDRDKTIHLFLPDLVRIHDRTRGETVERSFRFRRGSLTTDGLPTDPFDPLPPPALSAAGTVSGSHTAEEYGAAVEEARRRMELGEVYEIVLHRRFSTPLSAPPSVIYREIVTISPSPYQYLLQLGDEQLCGASPEMFVRVTGDRVESCPIAGTIRSDGNPMEDADRVRTLLNSRKDEAELTMCTDVDRNDKARICVPGSVRLVGRRLIERYAGLIHTVDHVEGRLRTGFTGFDAFVSHMWAVTLTGAPKRMAVQLIEQLEREPRRWYGGAVGAIAFSGDVRSAITIRTVHLHDGQADYRVGATLVHDSTAVEEDAETTTKATLFFRLLERLRADRTPRIAAARGADRSPGRGLRILLIDNEDSFVQILADYFRQTGAEVATYRTEAAVERLRESRPDLVVHSPGPGRPSDFRVPELVLRLAAEGVPQFGVCLGLQGIVEAFGGKLRQLPRPRQGKSWTITHDGADLFAGVPSPCIVGAYHALTADCDGWPEALVVTATTLSDEGNLVMAVRHQTLPIRAVQFHPESILTMEQDAGRRIIANIVATVVPS